MFTSKVFCRWFRLIYLDIKTHTQNVALLVWWVVREEEIWKRVKRTLLPHWALLNLSSHPVAISTDPSVCWGAPTNTFILMALSFQSDLLKQWFCFPGVHQPCLMAELVYRIQTLLFPPCTACGLAWAVCLWKFHWISLPEGQVVPFHCHYLTVYAKHTGKSQCAELLVSPPCETVDISLLFKWQLISESLEANLSVPTDTPFLHLPLALFSHSTNIYETDPGHTEMNWVKSHHPQRLRHIEVNQLISRHYHSLISFTPYLTMNEWRRSSESISDLLVDSP